MRSVLAATLLFQSSQRVLILAAGKRLRISNSLSYESLRIPFPHSPHQYGLLQPRIRSLPLPLPKLENNAPPEPGFAQMQLQALADLMPKSNEVPSYCSPFGTWTVGNCNEQVKKFPDQQNFYSCLADGSYSPYQNCDEKGENCQSCVYVDSGILIPSRAMPEGTRFCPTWFDDNKNNPCREPPGEAFLCEPREWTRLIWTWDDNLGKCIKHQTGICTSYRGLGFLSKFACQQRCSVDYYNDVCRLPVNKGCNCPSADKKLPVTRFFYDKAKNSCQSFQYFGCGWNGNNFETFNDCLSRCKLEVQDRVEIEVSSFNFDYRSAARAPIGSIDRLKQFGRVGFYIFSLQL